MGTYTRVSKLWSPSKGRFMVPVERLLALGLPALPCVAESCGVPVFPSPSAISRHWANWPLATANAMHVGSIGLVLGVVLSSVSFDLTRSRACRDGCHAPERLQPTEVMGIPVAHQINILIDSNPFPPGSQEHNRFEAYANVHDISGFFAAGGLPKDLQWLLRSPLHQLTSQQATS